MSEYDDVVERQRTLIEAEIWAKQVKSIHVHSMSSMYYETEDSKQYLEKGAVTDTEYNSGVITRTQEGVLVHTFGKQKTGEELLDSYIRHS